MNFASLFNQFRAGSNNTLNDLLDQQNATLSRVLDEDILLNEYKSGNSKLIEFMKYDKIQQLIDFITIIGPAEDKKRSYKYPLVASQILSSDNATVVEYFLPEGVLTKQRKYFQDQQVITEIEVEEQNLQQPPPQTTNPVVNEKTIIKDSLEVTADDETVQKQDIQPDNQGPIVKQDTPIQIEVLTEIKSVPQKKKAMIKSIEKIEKIQKIVVEPLISHLYQYFNQQVNYILTGYVCKVLNLLYTKKGPKMLEFLFKDNRIDKMINHIQSRSVGQFLLKVMTHQSNTFVAQRASFFTKLLKNLAINRQVHVLSNFSSFVLQTIQKAAANAKSNNPTPDFTTIFFTPHIVAQVIQNVMSEFENVSVYNAPILLTYLTNVPFTLPEDEKIVNQFKSLLEMFVAISIEKLNITNRQRPKLGFGRVKIIQILTYILKENLLGCRNIVGSQPKFFPALFNLCKQFQLNNVLHNQVVKIISIAFMDNSQQSLLGLSLQKDNVLINFLKSQAQEDIKIRAGQGSQKFRKGYIGHIVQICRLIQQYSSRNNQIAIQIEATQDFESILETLVERQTFENNKSLAGYSMKKNIKHEVMFQKQDIISHYFNFLSHSPKAIFQVQPQVINIEHPDFLQEMQRRIDETLQSGDASQYHQAADENNDPTSIVGQAIIFETLVGHFKGHLDFDVNELLEDL